MRGVIIYQNILAMDNVVENVNIILSKTFSGLRSHTYFKCKELYRLHNKGIYIYSFNIDDDVLEVETIIQKIEPKEEYFITFFEQSINEKNIIEMCKYLIHSMKCEKINKHIVDYLDHNMHKTTNYIIVENKISTIKIKIDDILYIEVRKDDITIHTFEDSYITKNSMNNIEKELQKFNFFRCHRSFLINLKKIKSINRNTVNIEGRVIPVSKYKINNLKKIITDDPNSVLCKI
ncbi:LytR/AlgR family response regulator transcription factor [Paraclostridium bifermentans]|uniref:LytR/AlgR family response regulator transcription factor n=1 Tax=Paraclostridium bifermentans TaxID=1490 RepID=UPI0018FE7556|nr:LytTR family DNA-binding domain-containing protein [Paraclostridium bifermentans]